jgi:plastocyanin
MQTRRWMSGIVAAGAAAAVTVSVMAGSAGASGLIAPVSAGPPKRPHLKHLDFNGFFPTITKIHVGDSVSWSINGFHTVSFLAGGQAPPPPILPSSSILLSGQLDAAKAPFWFNGQPQQIINPTTAFPSGGNTYDGSGFLSSGTPSPEGPPKPFVVKFTKAGTFTFNCLVHPGMKGVVKVLPKSKRVPTAVQDRATAVAEETAGLRVARKLGKVKPPRATVLAGNDGAGSVAWLRFFPERLKIKAGTTVTFKLGTQREIHTITIGPTAYTAAIETSFTTPLANAGGPPTLLVSPLGAYPSDPPPLPPFTGANHGNGFEGTGILAAGGGPLPSSAKIKFTKPGVYHFECVVHENMDGTITVTK